MARETIKKKRFAVIKIRSGSLLGILTLAAFILIISSSDVAIEYMKKGLGLCARAVIPSLFPFMIISELIVSSGIGIKLSKMFAKPMRALFGVSEAGAAAYFLGILCGFPIGAKTAVAMLDRGVISKRESERILSFCNNPGSAFVISAVGVSLLGSKELGVILYVCVILSSIIVGAVGKIFFGKSEINTEKFAISVEKDAIKSVTDAIQSSALSMLSVCSYVVFFSAFVGCIGAYLSRFSPPEELIAAIFGFFELSSGVGAAANVSGRFGSVILCALFLGWSGMSVHFQVMSVSSNRGLSFKPYVIAKAAQGVLCAAMAGGVIKLFPGLLKGDNSTAFSVTDGIINNYTTLTVAFLVTLIICVGIHLNNKSKKNKKSLTLFTYETKK